MLRKGIYGLVAILGVAALAWAGTPAEENVWVSDDLHVQALHGNGRAVFISDDSVSFDLSDLADGESRVIGAGDKQVTVSRAGDVATIRRPENGEVSELSITCRLGADTCRVVTAEDDPEQVMVVIRKTRRCENGEGDCADIDLDILGHGGAESHVVVRRTLDCTVDGEDGERDCHAIESPHLAHGEALVEILDMDGETHEGLAEIMLKRTGDANVFRLHRGEITLRCPEGDASMQVEREEADDVFLCPKHSVPLERVEPTIHRIEIQRPGPRDAD